ncbi:MAG: NADH-quinone oxidoreductase subunit NuoN [Actinobacteria bacterium]|nr:MAG: NADH-quinone oxidoreductase subunit NuoN [Actinomycetota bacterium]
MPVAHAPAIAWRAIGPALALSGGAILTLLTGAMQRRVNRAVLAGMTLATIGAASYLTFILAGKKIVGLQGMVAVDGVSTFTTMILLFTATIVTLMSYHYLSARHIHRFEYYPLVLLATAGMVLLASANDLILVFIALEVLSLALYVLVGLARRDSGAQEASLKYFLLGAFSSAILLYGVALAFGATGTTNISRIAGLSGAPSTDSRLMFAAAALLAVGFAFKIAVVPFHSWTPDVYQGAPTSVTGFMAAGTKAAGFAVLLRVFLVALGPLQWDWRPALWLIAIVTMVIGSLFAIVQSDVKRLLAYSSIAHAGFVLVGVIAATANGIAGSLFYLLVYAAMTLGAFAVVTLSAPKGKERLEMGSWVGLGQRHPVFAGAMTLFFLSLAGIPPTAGFMAKFFVFQAAVQAGETGLVIAGVLASVIAAFFYLRLIVLMWLQEPSGETGVLGLTPTGSLVVGITAAATIVFGVYPESIMHIARTAAFFTG